MFDRLWFVLTFVAALGCGVVGGAFFAFSTFVMRALGRIAPAAGIAAMQMINVTVINVWFMGALFGTAAVCIVLGVRAVFVPSDPGAGILLGASLLYLLGTVGVTIAFNVPRNDALAKVDAHGGSGANVWADYLRTWTAWNHVRTAAAIVAMGMFVIALWVARG